MTRVDHEVIEKLKNEKREREENKKWFEILTILTVALVYLSSGLLFYWTSPFVPIIVSDKVNYNINEEEASYFTGIRSVSVAILPFFLVSITNTIGRKKLLMASSIPHAVAWLIKASCTNLWLLYFSRLCGGIGDAILLFTAYPFVAEIASPMVRGVWANSLTIFCFMGQLIINVLGLYCNIQNTSYICITVPIIFFIILKFLPESPYFYVAKGDNEEAMKSLKKLRRNSYVYDEFVDMKNAVAKQEKGSWKELVTVATNRRALLISVFLSFSQNFSGVWTFGTYLQYIFLKSGTNIGAGVATIIYASVNLVLYSSAAFGSNKLGRRKSLLLSFILSGVTLFIQGIYFWIEIEFPTVNLKPISWLPLAGMLAFLLFSSFGVGIIPLLMQGELFAVGIKSHGMAASSASFGLASFITNTLFFYLESYFGLAGPFIFFAVCCFISAIVGYFIIPETKDKTLEQIQQLLSGASKLECSYMK